MRGLLLGVVLLGAASAGAAADAGAKTTDILYGAQQDVRSAETYSHLLMCSAQASLMRLQWSFNRWGLKEHKAAAAAHYDRFSDMLRRYREITQQAAAATDPIAAVRAEIAGSRRVLRASRDLPTRPAQQIAEILRLRAEYDADASRSALIRGRTALQELERRLGVSELKPSQRRVLGLARDILDDLRRTRGSISGSLPAVKQDTLGRHRKGRSLVLHDVELLENDAADLAAEIERLTIHFRLNNYIMGGKTDTPSGRK
ncbi:MAG: hypothetical protein ABIJ96_01485 [Elusimicrobiota bacterium]